MAFGKGLENNTQSGDAPASDVYMKLNEGEHVIRILDEEETIYWRYWIKSLNGKQVGRSIAVASMRDPLPAYFAALGKVHPDYQSIQKRFLVNVLDRATGKVKILELGKELLEKFAMLHERIRDRQTFEPLPITRFDVRVIARGTGKEINRVVLPDEDQSPLSEEVSTQLKYNLKLLARPMPPEFQQRLLAGEDYGDIIKELGWEKPVPTLPIDNTPF